MALWWQERGEETLMSEVSHVEDCICLATVQGHTLALSSFLLKHPPTRANKHEEMEC